MLGEVLDESSGRISGYRVLAADGLDSKIEPRFRTAGSCWRADERYGHVLADHPPGGALYGERRVLMVTDGGDVGPWRGFGVGQSTGRPSAASFGVAGAFYAAARALPRLDTIADVIEYEIDEDEATAGRCGNGGAGKAADPFSRKAQAPASGLRRSPPGECESDGYRAPLGQELAPA
jgi:hypothetical protein